MYTCTCGLVQLLPLFPLSFPSCSVGCEGLEGAHSGGLSTAASEAEGTCRCTKMFLYSVVRDVGCGGLSNPRGLTQGVLPDFLISVFLSIH